MGSNPFLSAKIKSTHRVFFILFMMKGFEARISKASGGRFARAGERGSARTRSVERKRAANERRIPFSPPK